jgi:hypothetical protein
VRAARLPRLDRHPPLDWSRLEVPVSWLRSNADLALMGAGLGAVSLAYATGAFVIALALHPAGQHGWRPVEMIAVGLYPLGWIGLGWGSAGLWTRLRRKVARGR